MSVLVVGGGLQGFELCYLADKSGRRSVLVDRKESPLARSVASDFFNMDVIRDFGSFLDVASDIDYLVPATENRETLRFLSEKKGELEPEVLFDFESFFTLCNKRDMYNELDGFVDTPPSHAESSPPWIAKPVFGSGSRGVKKIDCEEQLGGFDDEYVVQGYIDGVHYSTEAVVRDGVVYEYLTTVLEFDSDFGCCRIICDELDDGVLSGQSNVISSVVEGVGLNYLFDVQTVDNGEIYLIEVNPRFPSQTPLSVYWSSGVNLLEEMIEPRDGFIVGNGDYEVKPTVFEHFRFDGEVSFIGEIKLLGCDKLERRFSEYCEDLFVGEMDNGDLVGTAIFRSESMSDVEKKRRFFYSELKSEYEKFK